MKKDLPIGATTVYNNYKLVVVPQRGNLPSCAGCVFRDYKQINEYYVNCSMHNLACTPTFREDNKNVIFKLV